MLSKTYISGGGGGGGGGGIWLLIAFSKIKFVF